MGEGSNDERGLPDPTVIATHLWKRLKSVEPNLTQWDLLCLSASTTAAASLDNEVFKPVAVKLMDIIYAIHEQNSTRINSCLKSQASQTSPQSQTSTESQPHSAESPSRMDVRLNQLALEFPQESSKG